MFGMGMPEIILILAVALIFIGPKKLPELAKTLGKAMGEFRRATSDLKDSFNLDPEDDVINADQPKRIEKKPETSDEPETPPEKDTKTTHDT